MAVNLREGMRRVGLVLGAMGFCAGVFGGYLYIEPVLRQRSEANRFYALLSSSVVRREIEVVKLRKDELTKEKKAPGAQDEFTPADQWEKYAVPPAPHSANKAIRVPPGYTLDPPTQQKDPSATGTQGFAPPPLSSYEGPATSDSFDRLTAIAALCGGTDGWMVLNREIRAIHFESKHCEATVDNVTSIETADGQTVYRVDPPGIWRYLPALGFPFLGFLLPWGLLKTLTWIGAGFAISRNAETVKARHE
jgi:hypothetical protein